MEPVILKNIRIEIDRAEVVRLLGKKGNYGERLSDRIEKTLEEVLLETKGLLCPKGIYVITAGKNLPGSSMFEEMKQIAFCVCTIGSKLEEKVSILSHQGELLKAVILDSVGSVAAEATASFIDGLIVERAAETGLRTSCRASPGYGDWDIKEQRCIFDLLDGSKIGVHLSESSMMFPRKSISFAIDIAENPARMRSENSCRSCDMDTCPYRIRE